MTLAAAQRLVARARPPSAVHGLVPIRTNPQVMRGWGVRWGAEP